MTQVQTPPVHHGPRGPEEALAAERKQSESVFEMQCMRVCEHLERVFESASEHRKECLRQCLVRSSYARNLCLLEAQTSEQVDDCAH